MRSSCRDRRRCRGGRDRGLSPLGLNRTGTDKGRGLGLPRPPTAAVPAYGPRPSGDAPRPPGVGP
ncbi:hypothetical protein B0T14DRAFT_531430 [Immersiella caudata]|uniref:Uncharacterized protein n=1 Tax=Immersiella caudata TaxID=314043 RepID=A0AA39U568_9PEZI|nr:hypothetical protein B0T14DRAFT_531430 [Immersiella caudata]